MDTEVTEQKPAEVVERRMRMELLHPIAHDGVLYSRGVHELDESVAKLFLSFKGAVDKKPIAREFVASPVAITRGTTKPVK